MLVSSGFILLVTGDSKTVFALESVRFPNEFLRIVLNPGDTQQIDPGQICEDMFKNFFAANEFIDSDFVEDMCDTSER